MSQVAADLSNEDLWLSYLTCLADGNAPSDIVKKLKAIDDDEHKAMQENYFSKRGKLQVELGSIYLNEDQTLALRRYIRSENEELNIEEMEIKDIGRSQVMVDIRRRFVLVILLGLLGWGGYSTFKVPEVASFDIVQSLGYETLAFEGDPENRIMFPSNSFEEVRDFLRQDPELDKNIPLLNTSGAWQVAGTSVLDYEQTEIAVIRYVNKDDKDVMHYFALNASVDELPKTEIGNVDGFEYRAYASDRINMIVWKSNEVSLGVLTGRLSSDDMVAFIKAGSR